MAVRRWARERISVAGFRGGRRRRRPVLDSVFFFGLCVLAFVLFVVEDTDVDTGLSVDTM